VASRLDKLIDQAEATNEAIRRLTFLILPLLTAGAPPPVKKAVSIAPAVNQEAADAYFGALRGIADVVQNPDVGQSFIDASRPRAASAPKPRSAAQKKVAKMQSQAFKEANAALRNKNGSLKKGKTQSDVAKRAQRVLKKMKNGASTRTRAPRGSTRKGQIRKTSRRAYEKTGRGR
jgi:hypothetical protein